MPRPTSHDGLLNLAYDLQDDLKMAEGEMRISRLFPEKGSWIQGLCVVCFFAGVLCLLSGVLIIVGALEYALLLLTFLGIALLLGGVFLYELTGWLEKKNSGRTDPVPTVGQSRASNAIEEVIAAAILQALVVLLFGLILDNGVRQCACLYSCLGYWPGALLVIARRRSCLSWGDRLYLRWAWLPIVVICTVLYLRIWKSKGLI